LAASLRGFGPAGILAIAAIVVGTALFLPLSALLVLAWVRVSGTPWREIGYVRPASWIGSAATGVALGVALKFAMKAVVMPMLGADPVNHAFHYLAGNRAAIPSALYLMIVGAGFGEETLFRGYLFERFGKLFGRGRGARAATVVITSAVFGAAHYSFQGTAGTEQATIVGLIFGAIFATTGSLWMLMCAHASFDLTAYTMIYWDVETQVAHLVFRSGHGRARSGVGHKRVRGGGVQSAKRVGADCAAGAVRRTADGVERGDAGRDGIHPDEDPTNVLERRGRTVSGRGPVGRGDATGAVRVCGGRLGPEVRGAGIDGRGGPDHE
jgi:hypothetical protein